MTNNLQVWEEIFQKKEWGKYPSISVVKFIAKNFYKFENKKEIKILELGSGTGANLWFCAREGFSVYGIEGSQTAVETNRQRFKDENLEQSIVDLMVGDYFDILDTLENESFDAIIDVESLYCNEYDRTKEIITKAFDKLKPSGVMLSITFADGTWGTQSEETIGYNAVKPKEGPLGDTGYGRFTTREDIEKLYLRENNTLVSLERNELYLDNNEVIKEWLIELKKH